MAQFDVYRLSGGELMLDVQTDLLQDFDSRVAVPLLPRNGALVAHRKLNPTVAVDGQDYVMATQFIIALDKRELGRPVSNLDGRYDDIRAAIDMLFNGF